MGREGEGFPLPVLLTPRLPPPPSEVRVRLSTAVGVATITVPQAALVDCSSAHLSADAFLDALVQAIKGDQQPPSAACAPGRLTRRAVRHRLCRRRKPSPSTTPTATPRSRSMSSWALSGRTPSCPSGLASWPRRRSRRRHGETPTSPSRLAGLETSSRKLPPLSSHLILQCRLRGVWALVRGRGNLSCVGVSVIWGGVRCEVWAR